MDDWNTIVSFWDGLSSGAMLVSGRVTWQLIFITHETFFQHKNKHGGTNDFLGVGM